MRIKKEAQRHRGTEAQSLIDRIPLWGMISFAWAMVILLVIVMKIEGML